MSRVHYIEHLHDLSNFRENYQNYRYIEVKLTINLQNPAFPDLKNYCYNIIFITELYIANALETQEQTKSPFVWRFSLEKFKNNLS